MTVLETVNRIYREFKRYTGDGLAGEPTGAPLPVGDPQSGVYSPKKSELRAAFAEIFGTSEEAVEDLLSRYLGAYANDAAASAAAAATEAGTETVGQMYFNTTVGKIRVWNGAAWQDQSVALSDGDVTRPKVQAALAKSIGLNVFEYGAVGNGTTDDGAAFAAAQAAAISAGSNLVVVPAGLYRINTTVEIEDGVTWLFLGAELTTTSNISILSAAQKSDFAILGRLLVRGSLTTPASAAQNGLHIEGCKRYVIENVTGRDFKGWAFLFDGVTNPIADDSRLGTALRGDRGQISNISAFECTGGVKVDDGSGSEYLTFSQPNISGCVTGWEQGAGNVTVLGGTIVDNVDGVHLTAGANHAHGSFIGTKINHQTQYNVHAEDVTNGFHFDGCDFYGNAADYTAAIFLDGSKGIVFNGGVIGCRFYSWSTAEGQYNYVRNAFMPGDYGPVAVDSSGGVGRNELIIVGCSGPGLVSSGITLNDPSDVYVLAEKPNGSPISFSGSIGLTYATKRYDKKNAFNTGTGTFTVPDGQSGVYEIDATAIFGGSPITVESGYMELLINSVSTGAVAGEYYLTAKASFTGKWSFYLAQGDTVRLVVTLGGTSTVFGDASWRSTLSIKKVA